MMLAGKYEAFEAVPGAPITVQRARNMVSGRSVLIHEIAPGSENAIQTLKLALRYALRRPGSNTLLDIFDAAERTYIVTADRPDCLTLIDWLRRRLSGHRTKLAKRSSKSGTGEQFESGSADPAAGVRSPTKGSVEEPKADSEFLPASFAQKPAGRADTPGEFTRMFFDEKAKATKSGPPLFDTQVQRPTHVAQNPKGRTPVPAEPGEFTRLFRPGGAAGANPPVNFPSLNDTGVSGEREAVIDPLEVRDQRSPGEFTRLFAGRSPGEGDVQRPTIGGGDETQGNILPDVFSTKAPPSVVEYSTGQSEFTRIVQAPPRRQPEALEHSDAVPGNSPPPANAPSPSPLPKAPELKLPPPLVPTAMPHPGVGTTQILTIVGAVLLLALALVLVFTLRR